MRSNCFSIFFCLQRISVQGGDYLMEMLGKFRADRTYVRGMNGCDGDQGVLGSCMR